MERIWLGIGFIICNLKYEKKLRYVRQVWSGRKIRVKDISQYYIVWYENIPIKREGENTVIGRKRAAVQKAPASSEASLFDIYSFMW